jgi:hypothetical protein
MITLVDGSCADGECQSLDEAVESVMMVSVSK